MYILMYLLYQKISSSEIGYFNQTRPDEFKVSFVQHDKHPLPASMLDSIDPVPGVTVQEGDRIKKSTNKVTFCLFLFSTKDRIFYIDHTMYMKTIKIFIWLKGITKH